MIHPISCARRVKMLLGAAIVLACAAPAARAATVYSQNFESDAAGYVGSGSISTPTRSSLPTDSAGLNSANQSTWLGPIGQNVGKSGSQNETVTVTVTGLAVGQVYTVGFDLLIGASWDGSAAGYGPDSWRFAVDGTNLVNTTFSNGRQGVDVGAYSPQKYSDTTFNGLDGADFNNFTGADQFFWPANSQYGTYYGIYYFSHGAGNPQLQFVATGPSATLTFERYGATTDSADEYWAIDNVFVDGAPAAVPEPASLGLLAIGATALVMRRRK